jgi:Mg/Co/Ni transporter MgtE
MTNRGDGVPRRAPKQDRKKLPQRWLVDTVGACIGAVLGYLVLIYVPYREAQGLTVGLFVGLAMLAARDIAKRLESRSRK